MSCWPVWLPRNTLGKVSWQWRFLSVPDRSEVDGRGRRVWENKEKYRLEKRWEASFLSTGQGKGNLSANHGADGGGGVGVVGKE